MTFLISKTHQKISRRRRLSWAIAAALFATTPWFAACQKEEKPTAHSASSAPKSPSPQKTSSAFGKEAQTRLTQIAKARQALEAVIALVPNEKDRAQALEEQLRAAKKKLGEQTVKREMSQAARELDAAQQATGEKAKTLDAGERRAVALMQRARDVDTALKTALAPLPTPSAPLSANDRKLQRTVVDQQKALNSLAAASQMAFRSLTVVEQLRRAIPRLNGAKTPNDAP